MSKHRDRLIAVASALLVLVLAGTVMFAVLSAERNGRKALESLQLAQLDQLARLLDSALAPSLATPVGLTNPATGKPWNLTTSDRDDAAGLALMQSRMPPDTRTGYALVDANGVVVNGTLLTDAGLIGQRLTRPGLASVLAGKAALLPVDAHSLTTAVATIAIARPLTRTAGAAVTGAILQESDVAAESQFTQLMAGFRRARTDAYGFLDSNGVVIASTNPISVGKRAPVVWRDAEVGFHRHGATVAATADIPSAGWRAAFSQSTHEFEGNVTGPLRTALLFLIAIAFFGGGLAFFTLLSRLRAARREQERLASINDAREEFISIVSHELRTPATGQLGFLQTLLDHWDGMPDGDRHQTVTQAYVNARRLHALTRDVLDTASIEAGQLPYVFELVDIRDAVRTSVAALPETEREISVVADDASLLVSADPERIQQVLANLLDNAVKNSPATAAIELHAAAEADHVRVDVSD
ncbi:MAG TPA: histidine kinase dimerization/phospho-acceptor domain-containing protein, partial [Acidimicrobiales bacterium]|nr:histidine kinase dimerization/phospho-acceptor domain-containing protein [Acidimicrobiales bacterium]